MSGKEGTDDLHHQSTGEKYKVSSGAKDKYSLREVAEVDKSANESSLHLKQ